MGIKQYLAKDFMSKDIISVSADINIHDLVKIFVEHPVSALPVVGEKNTLLGIISEGDLLYKKVRPYVPQYMDVLGAGVYYWGYGRFASSFRKLLATKASEIMTTNVHCVAPDTNLETVTTLMIDEHLKSVPVVESPNKLVGMITRHDILQVIASSEEDEKSEK